jgi:hypothetical protein
MVVTDRMTTVSSSSRPCQGLSALTVWGSLTPGCYGHDHPDRVAESNLVQVVAHSNRVNAVVP